MNNKKVSRQSFIEEDIEVKPSTELTPDEYEHFQKSVENIEVHTFASDWECSEHDVEVFSKTLLKCGMEIKPEYKHNLETDNCNVILDKICEQSDTRSGLVILFSGYCMKDGCLEMFDGKQKRTVAIQEIWKKFNSHNCKSLKNKPKIFIFEVRNSTIPLLPK
nr:uncharacterized protein LOC111509864 [Leptinotarsa decemlineata]